MALKIRLRQQGRRNHYQYRLVLTDSRAPRDGKYMEMLGWYDPYATEVEKKCTVHADRLQHWIGQGAVVSEKAVKLIEQIAPELLKSFKERVISKRAKTCTRRKEMRRKRREALSSSK